MTGGLGGVMEAASAGAASAGGLTVGLLPGENRAAANRSVAVTIPTGLGEARNALVVRAADAVVALGGWSVVDDDGREVPGVRRASTAREAVRLALALAEQVRDIRP